jgi:hypothetical protein
MKAAWLIAFDATGQGVFVPEMGAILGFFRVVPRDCVVVKGNLK